MSLVNMLLNGSAVYEGDHASDIEDMAADMDALVGDDATTEAWNDMAIESLVSELYDIDKAYHIADIVAETKVIREGADPAVLLEGMISSGKEKIKAAFKKFWAKLKSWFDAVKRQLKILFLSGKKFVDEFSKEINLKKHDGFTYTGKEFDINGGDAMGESIFDAVNNQVNTLIGIVVANSKDLSKDKIIGKDLAKTGSTGGANTASELLSATEYQDEFIAGMSAGNKASDISELRENLIEKYHKGNDAKYTETIHDFDGTSKSEMVKFVSGFDKKIEEIKKKETKFDAMMNYIIKSYDKVKDEEGKEDEYRYAQYVSRYVSALLNVGKVPSEVAQAMYKEANAQYIRVLKQFLRWKPAKEGFEVDDDNYSDVSESVDLLDQAMNMLRG